MRQILFLRPVWAVNASFVKRDQEILSRHYQLTLLSYQEGDRLFFLRVIKHLRDKDICYVWFGGIHSFWALAAARLLGKKVVIVAGGYDAVYMPEIGYGLKYENKGWRRTYFAFRHVDRVLAFSDSSRQSITKISRTIDVRTVVLGFESERFMPTGQKRDMVLTVGHVNRSNVRRKGFETFVRVAAKMPELKFVIAGHHNDDSVNYLRSISMSNTEFTGYLPDSEILALMQRAKIYAQLSAHEGFGCALAEAMLCECTPVVTNSGAIPEVAGPDALYVDYGDTDATVNAIRQALSVESGAKYRERITELFPIEKREKELCRIIDPLIRT